MYNLEGDATNKMVNLGVDMMNSGFKLGGTLAKETLLIVLEKVKETQENKVGLTSVKKLLKSKDELNVVNLGKEHLDFFKSEAKRLGVGFASIGDKEADSVKIIYKTKDVNLIKNIMHDILDKTKAESTKEEINDKGLFNLLSKIDFKEHDENAYRHEVSNIDKNKALAIKDLLFLKGINNDAVVKNVQDNGKLTLDYKVNEADKEKAIDIIDKNKDKTIEEISNEINKIKKERGIENEVAPEVEKRKVPLKEQIENVDRQMKANIEKANAEKDKKKSKSKDKER